MAMALPEPPPPFDPNADIPFQEWYERFELYCSYHQVPAEPRNNNNRFYLATNVRRNLFVFSVGDRAYSVLRAACLPSTPTAIPIPLLVQILKQKYDEPGLKEANRFVFHQRNQKPEESVFDYISALLHLASKCEWRESHDEMMKSKLICGLKHKDTQQKLISEVNLTWTRAKDIALQDDAVRQQMKALMHAAPVNKVMKQKPYQQPATNKSSRSQIPKEKEKSRTSNMSKEDNKYGPCDRCTRKHNVHTCPAKEWTCYNCSNIGHTALACRQPCKQCGSRDHKARDCSQLKQGRRNGKRNPRPDQGNRRQEVHNVQSQGRTVDDEVDSLLDFTM